MAGGMATSPYTDFGSPAPLGPAETNGVRPADEGRKSSRMVAQQRVLSMICRLRPGEVVATATWRSCLFMLLSELAFQCLYVPSRQVLDDRIVALIQLLLPKAAPEFAVALSSLAASEAQLSACRATIGEHIGMKVMPVVQEQHRTGAIDPQVVFSLLFATVIEMAARASAAQALPRMAAVPETETGCVNGGAVGGGDGNFFAAPQLGWNLDDADILGTRSF